MTSVSGITCEIPDTGITVSRIFAFEKMYLFSLTLYLFCICSISVIMII